MGFLPPAEFLHPGLEESVEVSQSRRNSNCIPDTESTGTQKQQWRLLHWVEIVQEDHRFGFRTGHYSEVLIMRNDVLRLNQLPIWATGSFCPGAFPDPLSLLICLNWFKFSKKTGNNSTYNLQIFAYPAFSGLYELSECILSNFIQNW